MGMVLDSSILESYSADMLQTDLVDRTRDEKNGKNNFTYIILVYDIRDTVENLSCD